MLIIIYVGAITVLFLFVIMMLDINILTDKNVSKNFGYLPIIFLISFVFFIETFLMFSKVFTTYYHLIEQSYFKNNVFYQKFITQVDYITNVETIGHVLYTYYNFFFFFFIYFFIYYFNRFFNFKKKKKKKIN